MKMSKLSIICIAALSSASLASAADVLLNGAGATFPDPIYAKWFSVYNKANPTVKINYQPIGSGGGIRQLQAGTVDFGATDSPMTDEQIKASKTKVLHFPTVLGAVVATYNLPSVKQELNFSGDALAGIYLGKITKWNDAAIRKDNPGVTLPNEDIVVVHRSDGSGTTFVFTDFLSKVNAEWKAGPGPGNAVKWPVGVGGKGNEGVSGLVQQTPFSIGYVELVYALQNKMAYAKIKNAAGKFVKAELASVTAAAASTQVPADFRVSITNAAGEKAYPVASFTWLLIYDKIDDATKRNTLTAFLKWMLKDGQKLTTQLGYAPLPESVRSAEEKAISLIK
jgi:phosphate transport system substrate-binding protein